MPIQNYSVVDLFCGIGGLTHGFEKEGFNVSHGLDFDKTCEYAYNRNNKSNFLHSDVALIKPAEVDQLYPKGSRRILVGCAPCQPFSIFNRKSDGKVSKENNQRWRLLDAFLSLILETKPEIISMENVPLLRGFKKGEIFGNFVTGLENAGYFVYHDIHDAQDYGVPQRRKRLILLASLNGPISMIPPTHSKKKRTVYDAIGKMPPIHDGETHKSDALHKSRKLAAISKKRIQATPEGGGWKDWPIELVAECHKKDGGKAYASPYGRMSWKEVAPTITTCCTGYNNGRFGHPTQDRAISLREAACLQSFPRKYAFINPESNFSAHRIATHIGNAVPVGLSKAIARSIKSHISKYSNATG